MDIIHAKDIREDHDSGEILLESIHPSSYGRTEKARETREQTRREIRELTKEFHSVRNGNLPDGSDAVDLSDMLETASAKWR